MDIQERMRLARKRVARMYASDRKHGLATPAHAPVASHAATALEALEAALTTEDWELVEDAYLLLEGVVNRLRAGEAVARGMRVRA